jgi:ubiquinone biosynthesis protein
MAKSPLPKIPWFTRRSLLSRSQQILAALFRHGMGWLMTRSEEDPANSTSARKLLRQAGRTQAGELVQALIELGPTFIKFGQALGARADLLPTQYIEALSKLQDEIPPLPFEPFEATLTAELGRPVREIFAEFDHNPIASASIGQVYAAQLWTGEDVVVKIVRPGAEKIFEQDLEILSDMAEWAHQHTPLRQLLNLPALVEEFAYTVRAEFDYMREGRNADVFRHNFADDTHIYIPVVHWEYTTRRVITMERVAGLKINDLTGLDEAGIDRQRVAENLMHFAMRQIFEFGLYHADPHAGNFFVQPDASLAVVDFGMVGRLSHQTKRTFLGIAIALERGDANILVDELLNAGILTRALDRRALTRDFERLFDRLSGASLRELSAAQFMGDVMSIALRHGLQLPGELVTMLRGIAISEGTGTTLYPGFELIEFAVPYIKRFWSEERSPMTMMPRMAQSALDGVEFTLDLPRRANRLLNQIERGQFEVNISQKIIDELTGKLQKMTNRMAISMILSAVIIALSLVMVVYKSDTWQNLGDFIFGFAFISSVVFGGWLIWSILRSGRT